MARFGNRITGCRGERRKVRGDVPPTPTLQHQMVGLLRENGSRTDHD